MIVAVWALLVIYTLCLLFIFFYCITQFSLLFYYLRYRKNQKDNLTELPEKLPAVTIQLPIFNESYVAKRLIRAVTQLNYPKDLLQIQVLDDSTDETLEISQQLVLHYQKEGFDIELLHREDRQGYKAGALQEGLQRTKGELIAIFDADFIPSPHFLKQSIPSFSNPEIGMVQSKWQHINRNFSLLTRIQAFQLDAHFSIEQGGRNGGGFFMNFNGTAGIWRKACIEEAGGWSADTLTEDLDLSYRAQLKGWKFIFLETLGSPAELPMAMSAIKSQQYRWNKGAAEVARKNIFKILSAPLSLSEKWQAIFHLLNSSVYLFIFLTALLSVPLLLIKDQFPQFENFFQWASIFLVSTLAIGLVFLSSELLQKKTHPFKTTGIFILKFPVFIALSIGLSLHNSIAVAQGWLGKKTAFIRTPKFNISKNNDHWLDNKYLQKQIPWLSIFEILMALYFLAALLLGIYLKDYGLFVFHLLTAGGFFAIFYYSVKHSFFGKKPGA